MRRPLQYGLTSLVLAGAGVAGAFGSAGTAGAAAASTATASGTAPATLSVLGNGSAEVTPDLASFAVDVVRSAPSAARSLADANVRIRAIVAALRSAGVPASGIQTTGVSTTNTSHPTGSPGHRHLVRRFSTDESLSVDTTAGLAGAAIDAATRAGAGTIDGLAFAFSDPDAGMSRAEAAAIASARRQADAAAAATGQTVTGVASIDLHPDGSAPAASMGGTNASAAPTAGTVAAPTTPHPGRQQVNASVRIVYTIAPAS